MPLSEGPLIRREAANVVEVVLSAHSKTQQFFVGNITLNFHAKQVHILFQGLDVFRMLPNLPGTLSSNRLKLDSQTFKPGDDIETFEKPFLVVPKILGSRQESQPTHAHGLLKFFTRHVRERSILSASNDMYGMKVTGLVHHAQTQEVFGLFVGS